jgi:hypothetical protein
MSESDPGAALPSRVQELIDIANAWGGCSMKHRPEHCSSCCLHALASALQQTQADLKAAEIVIEASERSERELSGRLDRQIRDYKIIAAKLDTAEAAHQRLREATTRLTDRASEILITTNDRYRVGVADGILEAVERVEKALASPESQP